MIACPLPSIVKLPFGELFAIAGRALPNVIVPLTLKLMVVATVGEPFAVVIAARRLPAPVSLVLVTVIAALAIPVSPATEKLAQWPPTQSVESNLPSGPLPPAELAVAANFSC